ncbi:MAG TPA: hypothetical protein PKI59_02850, partial [Candidatus Cloacimonadota bacterium]|nr:hypothetical protein [Candidatus Cloacimonadota bacterium]
MKRSVLCITFILAVVCLSAQQPVLLRNAQYLGFEGTHVNLPSGATIVFWNDTSSGSSDVMAQKVNSEGLVLWPGPRPIASSALEDRVISVTLSSDDNIIVYYYNYASDVDGFSYWLQKFSQAGQPLWGGQGILVSSEFSAPKRGCLVPNAIGGAYLIYKSSLPAYNIYGMNLDSSGTNLWPHTPLSSYSSITNVQALEDGFGGVIINYCYNVSGSSAQNRLIRLDAAGDIVGTDPLLDPASVVPLEFSIMKDGQGNFILYTMHWLD